MMAAGDVATVIAMAAIMVNADVMVFVFGLNTVLKEG